MSAPLFFPWRLVVTSGAFAACEGQIEALFARHVRGDWGAVADEDKVVNNRALMSGERILAAYPIDPDKPCLGYGENTVWIITEAGHETSTVLLPEEY